MIEERLRWKHREGGAHARSKQRRSPSDVAVRQDSAFRQEAESGQEVGLDHKSSRPDPSDSLPPARLGFLKVPKPTKTAQPAGGKVFKYRSLRGTQLIQTLVLMLNGLLPVSSQCVSKAESNSLYDSRRHISRACTPEMIFF